MNFFSPELLASNTAIEQFGKESDVWAFGVTLYALLFGKLPFTGKTGPVLMRAILMEELMIPDFFPVLKQESVAYHHSGSSPSGSVAPAFMKDPCPFLSRHLEELEPFSHQPILVPEALKDLLRGLLLRDPAGRLSLRAFRRSEIARHPQRWIAGHMAKLSVGSEPKAVPTDGLQLTVAPDNDNHPLAAFLPTVDGKPSVLAPTLLRESSASITSTLDSMEDGSNSHDYFGGDLHVTAEDLEAAVTQCSVVLNAPRRGGEQDQTENLIAPTTDSRAGLSHFVQRLRDKAFDARLVD
jgi:serine/threonine protein kinase